MSASSVNLIEAENFARAIGREITNEDVANAVSPSTETLTRAAEEFAVSYSGTNTFIPKVRGKSMTVGRTRAVLNVMRQELLGLPAPTWGRKPAATASAAPAAPAARSYKCFWRGCDESFGSMAEVLAHKKGHRSGGATPAGGALPAPASYIRYKCVRCGLNFGNERSDWEKMVDHNHEHHGGRPRLGAPVIVVRDSKLNLDLSDLPDGNYAFPNPDKSSSHDHLYFQVKRARRRAWRDRLFTYGHHVKGGEWVEAGTIEVREWSGDTKRLFGEQKPGDVYRGEHEEIIEMIKAAPEICARQFGMKIGRCGICGKTLTDDESLAVGIGPECLKKPKYFTEAPKSYRMQSDCPTCHESGKIVYVYRAKTDKKVSYECRSGHEWESRMDEETEKKLVS